MENLMNKRNTLISLLVIGVVLIIAWVVFSPSLNSYYFIDFESTQAVQNHLENQLPIGQSSSEDVISLVRNRQFGIDCGRSISMFKELNTDIIVCTVPMEEISFGGGLYYLLEFRFEDDMLIEIIVKEHAIAL